MSGRYEPLPHKLRCAKPDVDDTRCILNISRATCENVL